MKKIIPSRHWKMLTNDRAASFATKPKGQYASFAVKAATICLLN
jgi:hypothetical protein